MLSDDWKTGGKWNWRSALTPDERTVIAAYDKVVREAEALRKEALGIRDRALQRAKRKALSEGRKAALAEKRKKIAAAIDELRSVKNRSPDAR